MKTDNFYLFNATYDPAPSLEDYVENIKRVLNSGFPVFQVPYFLLIISSYIISFILDSIRLKHPFSPLRVRKLVISNKVKPLNIVESGYEYIYTTSKHFLIGSRSAKNDW